MNMVPPFHQHFKLNMAFSNKSCLLITGLFSSEAANQMVCMLYSANRGLCNSYKFTAL